jgi:superfamily II DNA/RNA helicase
MKHESFDQFALPAELQRALREMQFSRPTPIQEQAIPLAIQGRDLLATAQTGTGKTAAFSLPILVKTLREPGSTALILTPTRELAAQVAEVVKSLSRFCHHVRSAVLVGGAGMGYQLRALEKKPALIIATPGRLMDHLNRRSLDLSKTGTVVLDEADRMLDMGFAPQIENIFKFLPKKRQTLLFSATLPSEILKLAQRFMHEPERVSVGKLSHPAEKINQIHIELPGIEKNQRVLEELQKRNGSVLVFARTKIRTDRLAKFLKQNGIKASAIHGGRTQSQRNEALAGFRSMKYPVLVATDVAARGLDIPDIQTVINFDLPQTREDYIHRIGRTARAGESGEALSFVTPEEMKLWRFISKTGTESGPAAVQGRSPGKFRPRRGFGSHSKRSSWRGHRGHKNQRSQ